jgi:hypothetical protein
MNLNEELRRAAELAGLYSLLANYYAYRDAAAHGYYHALHLQYMERTAALVREGDPHTRQEVAAALPAPMNQNGWGTSSPHRPVTGGESASLPSALPSAPQKALRPVPQRDSARVRAIHTIPDAPPIDVYVDGRRLLSGIAYKATTDYFTVPSGHCRVDIIPAGTKDNPLYSNQVTLSAGASYTFTVLGGASRPDFVSYTDHPFAPPDTVQVRFLHLSPDAPAVDLAVAGGQLLAGNIGFRQPSRYVAVSPSAYNLEVREAGTPNVLLSIPNVKLGGGVAYTIATVGRCSGSPPLDIKLLRG